MQTHCLYELAASINELFNKLRFQSNSRCLEEQALFAGAQSHCGGLCSSDSSLGAFEGHVQALHHYEPLNP